MSILSSWFVCSSVYILFSWSWFDWNFYMLVCPWYLSWLFFNWWPLHFLNLDWWFLFLLRLFEIIISIGLVEILLIIVFFALSTRPITGCHIFQGRLFLKFDIIDFFKKVLLLACTFLFFRSFVDIVDRCTLIGFVVIVICFFGIIFLISFGQLFLLIFKIINIGIVNLFCQRIFVSWILLIVVFACWSLSFGIDYWKLSLRLFIF